MEFNQEQLKVINHISGPLLCIAGPGSGKTTSIIQRVVNMTNKGISPQSILVVTFTKAAAEDMKQKYYKQKDAKQGVTFGTIHSFCFSVLRKYNNDKYNKDSILTDIEQRDFIRAKIRPLRIEWSDQEHIINSILGAISNIKNNGINPNSIEVDGCSNETFLAIYNAYEKFKAENNKIDYDDMLFITNQLFEKDHMLIDSWRDKFQYLIIDEFQDTNKLQAKILYDLAYPNNNICIIGDDDQSIYAFRGAVPEIMLNFEKQYPYCTKVILNKNYRSTPEIVASTKKLIEKNEVRFAKPLESTKTTEGEVQHLPFKNRDKEIAYIIKTLKSKQKDNISLNNIAILYRTNNQVPQLTQALVKANIPFYTYELVLSNYDHWIFRDIKLFKKVVDGTCTTNEFLSIINRPNKFVSRKILPIKYSEKGVIDSSFKLSTDWQKKKLYDQLSDWYDVIHKMKEMVPSEFIQTIRKSLNYDKFIEKYAEENRLDKSQFFDILDEIQDDSEPFEDYDAWMNFVQLELENFKEKMKHKTKDCSVSLLTMHRAKGLEWDEVFIIDANEDITPYYKAENSKEIEEERRMFYVAATRAKTKLTICSIEKRNKTPMVVSRFVSEMLYDMPKRDIESQLSTVSSPVQFQKGNWVFHKTFGIGIITAIDTTKLVIAFENAGVKTLEKKWCMDNLQIF